MRKSFALVVAALLLSPAVVVAAECVDDDCLPTAVPEPGSLALLGLGLLGLAVSRRKS